MYSTLKNPAGTGGTLNGEHRKFLLKIRDKASVEKEKKRKRPVPFIDVNGILSRAPSLYREVMKLFVVALLKNRRTPDGLFLVLQRGPLTLKAGLYSKTRQKIIAPAAENITESYADFPIIFQLVEEGKPPQNFWIMIENETLRFLVGEEEVFKKILQFMLS